MTVLPQDLQDAAAAAILLVAVDFDGTISELAPEPDLAVPHPRSLEMIRELSLLERTYVAIVSGRGRADLGCRVQPGSKVFLIGSHGAEMEAGVPLVSVDARQDLETIGRRLDEIAADMPGALVERKPAGIALHYRKVDPRFVEMLRERTLDAASCCPRLRLLEGSCVLEFLAAATHKGEAVAELARRVGASVTVFMGDDHTDEHAFLVLRRPDVSIKVGPGESHATLRVPGVLEAGELLAALCGARKTALATRRSARIEELALLSDQRTFAIVGKGAAVRWLCLPRLDAPAIFADLLGSESDGVFEIAPTDEPGEMNQRYEPDSFTLTTSWPGLAVSDFLDAAGGRAFQRPGRCDLIRIVRAERPFRVWFAPRMDFARTSTRLRVRAGGLEIDGSPDPIVLYAPGVDWTIVDDGVHHIATAELPARAEPWVFELRYGSGHMHPSVLNPEQRRAANSAFWSGWARSLKLPRVHPELVKRSALVLKALTYGPSGAMAAAATTSLPEQLGGVRNWDYRFCWPRDAALACAALIRLGNTGHALRYLDWLSGVTDRVDSAERMRPLYTVAGSHGPPEGEIGSLRGYAESRPVRIGNAAAAQVQLDVFGPIVDVVAMLVETGAPIGPDHWRLVRSMVQAVEARWAEPDHGIWEVRTAQRHHLHSKLMCWFTVHRALVVEQHVRGEMSATWQELAGRIREDLLEKAWSERLGCYVSAYGHEFVDAAALLMAVTGVIGVDDPRLISTIERIEAELSVGSGSSLAVLRYKGLDDGLPGREGAMEICAGWMARALCAIGRRERARAYVDALASRANGLGLLAEQTAIDREPGEPSLALGNFPQAYSHLALIDACVDLDRESV